MALSSTNYAVRKKDKYGGETIIDSKSYEESQQNLSLYQFPPTEIISLKEFEEYGRTRMNVLKKVEQLREKFRQGSTEYKQAFSKEIDKLMPLATGKCFKNNLEDERRKDRISHCILRMAFCQSPEQTKWFIQQEVELFRSRFSIETQDNILNFLRVNNFELEQVQLDEKRHFSKQLSAGNKIPEEHIDKTEFWKVEFSRAFELIRGRKVFLWKGMIYITFKELVAVIATRLRLVMSKAMAKEAMNMGRLNEEERLLPMLRKLTKIDTNSGYQPKNANEITPQMVDELSKKSFPPCMKHIHSNLRQEHHLRHFARRQYGLFLKDAGMSLESSLEFFRKEFIKKIDANKFDKEYAYNIRHCYGKEGSHREGSGYACTKIILTNPPAAQDCHGCPFRHCDPGLLPQRLQNMGLTNDEAQKVSAISNQKRYDIACARFFEYQHQMEEGALGAVITHPNQYFDASRQIYDGKRSRNAAKNSQEIHLTVKKKEQKQEPLKDEFDEDMEF
uniref:DNA primase large subunit n=1 Tax=Panagrolaimus superbus TaxID=310955 RepID=A0A914Y6X0_9BILA